MPELFSQTEVLFGGAMTAQKGIITETDGLSGVLMQNFNIQYSQAVSRIYELGVGGTTTRVYYISGRAQGTLSAAHVVGPGLVMSRFYTKFSNVCNAGGNELNVDVSPNICSGFGAANVKYKAKFCVLTTIGMSVAAQDFVINEQSQLMFSGLEFTG